MSRVDYQDFTTGLALNQGAFSGLTAKTKDFKAAAVAQNVILTANGIAPAKGYVKANTDTPPVGRVNGATAYTRIGSPDTLYEVLAIGSALYTFANGAYTQIYTGLNAVKDVFFIEWQNLLIIMNGSDPLLQFDGTTVSTVSITGITAFKPRFAVIGRGRIFYMDDPVSPDLVWTPTAGTVADFTSAATSERFPVDEGAFGRVRCAASLTSGIVFFFKEGATYQLTGSQPFASASDPFVLNRYSTEIGCQHPKSIVNISDQVYFWSKTGPKNLSQVPNATVLVKEYDPLYHVQPLINKVNRETSANVVAVYSQLEQLIYFHFPRTTELNTETVCYSPILGAITTRTGLSPKAVYFAGLDHRLIDYNGNVLTFGTGLTYNGLQYPVKWVSLWNQNNSANIRKLYTDFYADFSLAPSQGLQFKIRFRRPDGSTTDKTRVDIDPDNSDGWNQSQWNESVWNAGAEDSHRKKRLGRGVALQMEISSQNSITTDFNLSMLSYNFESKGTDRR